MLASLYTIVCFVTVAFSRIDAIPHNEASVANDITSLSAVSSDDHRSEGRQRNSGTYGGRGGLPWSDMSFIQRGTHRRIREINMWCGERLNGIQFGFADLQPDGFMSVERTPIRGTADGQVIQITLDYDNWINGMWYITREVTHGVFTSKTTHTEIGYLKFSLHKGSGDELACGHKSDTEAESRFEIDFGQWTLLYMSGYAGQSIDSLQGHYIPLQDYAR